jgi:iron complex outermembrane recepter protein
MRAGPSSDCVRGKKWDVFQLGENKIMNRLRVTKYIAFCAISISLPFGLAIGQATLASPQISSPTPNTSSSERSENTAALAEVIVTAQRRTERLQDVPISLTALSGAALDTASSAGVFDALMAVPGVSILGQNGSSLQGGGAQITIRGVGPAGEILSGSSPIGYYIDSVPFSLVHSAGTPDLDVYDLKSVEVLRGPQGTLYGANSEGGLVRVLTNDANLNDFDFKVRTSLSSTDFGGGNYRGDAMVNLPLIDGVLAARLVVGNAQWSGWINSPSETHLNSSEIGNYRLKIDAQPTDELSAELSAWHSQSSYAGCSCGVKDGTTLAVIPTPTYIDFNAFALKVAYDLPGVTLLSQSSYLGYGSSNVVDLTTLIPGLLQPGDPLSLAEVSTIQHAATLSQEFTLVSKSAGPWTWDAGAIFRYGKDQFDESGQIFGGSTHFDDGSKSTALYGQLSQRFLADQLQWTLGGRYYHDESTSGGFGFGAPPGQTYYESTSYNKFTPKATLSWFPSSTLTVYGTFAEGFRPGSAQDAAVSSVAPNFPALNPDELFSYEIGAKGSLFDHRLSFDFDVNYMKWKDVQQVTFVNTPPGSNVFLNAFVNGPDASGPGAEFSVQARPFEGLEINLAVGWNQVLYRSYEYEPGTIPSPSTLIVAPGDRASDSPEWNGSASVQYTFPVTGGYSGQIALTDTINSPMFSGREGINANGVGVYGDQIMLNAVRVAVLSPKHWTTTIYVDNLNNERGIATPVSGSGIYTNPLLRPRTIGIQVEYHLK